MIRRLAYAAVSIVAATAAAVVLAVRDGERACTDWANTTHEEDQ